jgi:hypothetical protein
MAVESPAIPDTTLVPSIKFSQLSMGEKVVFCGKVVIFFCTFGFAFPTILND